MSTNEYLIPPSRMEENDNSPGLRPSEAKQWWETLMRGAIARLNNGVLSLTPLTDATRGAAGQAGRVIFNSDDGNLNIDDGTNWILPDGTIT